jgi:undecaprenyl diphosphate synthase
MPSIPKHIAIIMDGNGRWAKKKGLPRIAGHRAGAKAVEEAIKGARSCGVKILTLYAFSTENWKRPKNEVSALFGLLENYIDKELERLHKNGIRFSVIGKIEDLPDGVRDKLYGAIDKTKNNKDFTLNLALNYGSRAEITDAARRITKDCLDHKLDPESIDEALFSSYLYTKDLSDPDILIRTSGEMRLSNFLLWQASYTELYMMKKMWPDFKKEDIKKAIAEYQRRERRYGG